MALLSVFLIDWMNTPPPSHVSGRRFCEEKLSLGARNVVGLRFRNRTGVPLALEVKDETPHLFDVSGDAFSLTLPADSDATASYTVIPKKRGNYKFGDINIRYLSKLKLFKRQARLAQSMMVNGPLKSVELIFPTSRRWSTPSRSTRRPSCPSMM